jgi:hypothetical protein
VALTAKCVQELVEYMKPQGGEVVMLVFVCQQDGQYLMAAPISNSWQEMLTAVAHQRGIIPGAPEW